MEHRELFSGLCGDAVGKKSKKVGMYVYMWLIYTVQQKLTTL